MLHVEIRPTHRRVERKILIDDVKKVFESLNTQTGDGVIGIARFSSRNKRLGLSALPDYVCESFIRNTSNSHLQGETTAIYTEVKIYLQELANKLGRDICYSFNTATPSMIAWAKNRGTEMFGWTIEESKDYSFSASKIFKPQSVK
jgi:hypothetical protein